MLEGNLYIYSGYHGGSVYRWLGSITYHSLTAANRVSVLSGMLSMDNLPELY